MKVETWDIVLACLDRGARGRPPPPLRVEPRPFYIGQSSGGKVMQIHPGPCVSRTEGEPLFEAILTLAGASSYSRGARHENILRRVSIGRPRDRLVGDLTRNGARP
jgi:hypothetical protein